MPIHVKVVSQPRTTPRGSTARRRRWPPRPTTRTRSGRWPSWSARGEKVYAANCAACHQANGKGAGPIKPLDGSPIVLDADKAKQIHDRAERRRPTARCRPGSSCRDTEIAAVVTYTKNQLVEQDRPDRAAGRSRSPRASKHVAEQGRSAMSAVLDHHGDHAATTTTTTHHGAPARLAALGVRDQPQGHRHDVPAVLVHDADGRRRAGAAASALELFQPGPAVRQPASCSTSSPRCTA